MFFSHQVAGDYIDPQANWKQQSSCWTFDTCFFNFSSCSTHRKIETIWTLLATCLVGNFFAQVSALAERFNLDEEVTHLLNEKMKKRKTFQEDLQAGQKI